LRCSQLLHNKSWRPQWPARASAGSVACLVKCQIVCPLCPVRALDFVGCVADEPWPLGHNWVPPVGCPCTKELLCDKDYRMWEFVHEPVGQWSKHNCTAPWEDDEGDYYKKWMYSIDGGSGAILSRGLMEAIDHQEMERCIRNQ